MKKICVDARSLFHEANGISRYLRENIVSILDQSNEIYFILISNKKIIFNHSKKDMYECIIDERYAYFPGTIWLQVRANYIANKNNSSIFWSPAHIAPIVKSKKLNYILTIHDVVANILPESMEFKNRVISKILFNISLKKSDFLVSVSKTTLKDLNLFYPFSKNKKFKVIYEGKSLNDKYDGELLNENFLFVLGSLEPRKNILYLIKSFEILLKEITHLKLYITGTQGWNNNDIKNYINENNLEENISFTGYLTDQEIKKFLLSAKAFIFPSLYEGFGLPLLEAESKSVVIASDIEIFRELSEYMDNLNFIDFKKDINQSAKEIKKVLDYDEKKVLKFKTNKDQDLFSWYNSGKIMIDIFEQLDKKV